MKTKYELKIRIERILQNQAVERILQNQAESQKALIENQRIQFERLLHHVECGHKYHEQEEKHRLSLKKVTLPTQPSVFDPVPLPAPCTSKFHPVYVTDVTTPSKLVVQLIGKETTQALECLQEEMTCFYRSKEGKTFTIEDTYTGQSCCACSLHVHACKEHAWTCEHVQTHVKNNGLHHACLRYAHVSFATCNVPTAYDNVHNKIFKKFVTPRYL